MSVIIKFLFYPIMPYFMAPYRVSVVLLLNSFTHPSAHPLPTLALGSLELANKAKNCWATKHLRACRRRIYRMNPS